MRFNSFPIKQMVHDVKIKDTSMVQTSMTCLSWYELIEKKNQLRNSKPCIYHLLYKQQMTSCQAYQFVQCMSSGSLPGIPIWEGWTEEAKVI